MKRQTLEGFIDIAGMLSSQITANSHIGHVYGT